MVVLPVRHGPLSEDEYLLNLTAGRAADAARLLVRAQRHLAGVVASRYDTLTCMGYSPCQYYELSQIEREAVKVIRHQRKHRCFQLPDQQLREWREAYLTDLPGMAPDTSNQEPSLFD